MITFRVDGIPRPKQSFKMGKHGGYTPARIKSWQNAVAWQAKEMMMWMDMLTGSLAVVLDFYLPDRHRRDSDNLSKAVLDAMNGIVYQDDTQIDDLHIRKFYNDPRIGVSITINEIGGERCLR